MTEPPERAANTEKVAELLQVSYETARAVCWAAVMFEKLGRPPEIVGAALAILLEQVPPPPRPGAH